MKKYLPLPIVTAVLSGAGFILRRWQLAAAFERDTGLLRPGMPATWLLLAVTLLGAVVYFLLCLPVRREDYPDSYAHCFHAPNPVPLAMQVLAGGLLAAGGILGVWGYFRGEGTHWSRILLGAAAILTGIAMEEIGRRNFLGQPDKGRFASVLLAPGYCGCVWLVVSYQGHTANPNVMEYVFLLLGVVAAILASYFMACFSFEGPKPRRAVWFAAMGVQLLCTALADGGGRFELCVAGGYALFLFTQMTVLLYRGARPSPLPPPAPPEPDPAPEEEETEAREEAPEELTDETTEETTEETGDDAHE